MKLALISPYYDKDPSGANKRFESIVSECSKILGKNLIVVTHKNYPIHLNCHSFKNVFIPNLGSIKLISRMLIYLWLNIFHLYCYFNNIKIITDFNPVTITQFFSSNQYQLIHDVRISTKYGRWSKSSKFLMAFLWKRIKKIITVSQTSKHLLEKNLKIPSNRVIVSYNGVSPSMKNINDKNNKKNIDLLYVATFEDRKNHINLLKSLLLIDQPLNVVFVGFDNGNRSKIDEFILSNNFVHKISIKSGITDKELKSLYSKTKIFIYPSLYEGFGMPLIEAASESIPVICSDIPVFREIMKDYPLYFDPKSPEEIAYSINKSIKPNHTSDIDFDMTPYKWENIVNLLLNDINIKS